jgi:hypothetical protein
MDHREMADTTDITLPSSEQRQRPLIDRIVAMQTARIERRFDAIDAAIDAIREDLAAYTKLLADRLALED